MAVGPSAVLDGIQHLTHLIGFGPALVVLDVHPGIPRPWRAVHAVASVGHPGLPEKMVADTAKLGESNTRRIGLHPTDQLIQRGHRWYYY
jgi:hypothetical protein